MMGPGALAIILARAGSKGVPGKNTADIAGRPCIAWTFDAVRGARTVARTVVSTDDARVLAVAAMAGVAVIQRPGALASDTATVDDAVRHAVKEIEQKSPPAKPAPGTAPAPIVILYGNVPIRPPGLIDGAVQLLLRTGCDSVQSYSPVGKHHPWWTARLDPSGRVSPWEGETLNHGVYRRQDLPAAHIPDGGVLVVSRRALFGEIKGVEPGPHAFLGRDRRGVVSPGLVVDIDSLLDLAVADTVLRSRTDEDR